MKANVGMRYAVAAVIDTYTPYSGITYDDGFVVGEARGANVTWELEDGEFRGDDIVLDTAKGILGYSVELETAGMKDAVRSALLGETKDSSDAYHITGAEAPDVGFGYVKQMRETDESTGAVGTTWEVFWYYKLKFGQPNEEARTKEQNTEWRTPTITGAGAGVFTTSGQEQPDYAEHKTFATLALAKTYLNGKAGIT
jgi:phi13 family phage major tail protein